MNAKNISEILDALASRFGATGAHLWSLMVRQSYVEGVQQALLSIFFLLAILWMMYSKKMSDLQEKDDGYTLIGIFCGLACIVGFFMTFGTATTDIFNPEGAALLRLLGSLK